MAMLWAQWIGVAAQAAILMGVLIAGLQLQRQTSEARSRFEDVYGREYRARIATIPVKAMLGEPLEGAEFDDHLDEFQHYFELSNQQAFLARHGRVRAKTWRFWRQRILDNMQRRALAQAWDHISRRAPNDFQELRRVLAQNPRWQRRPRQRRQAHALGGEGLEEAGDHAPAHP
jgi:hypothetical protein